MKVEAKEIRLCRFAGCDFEYGIVGLDNTLDESKVDSVRVKIFCWFKIYSVSSPCKIQIPVKQGTKYTIFGSFLSLSIARFRNLCRTDNCLYASCFMLSCDDIAWFNDAIFILLQ